MISDLSKVVSNKWKSWDSNLSLSSGYVSTDLLSNPEAH